MGHISKHMQVPGNATGRAEEPLGKQPVPRGGKRLGLVYAGNTRHQQAWVGGRQRAEFDFHKLGRKLSNRPKSSRGKVGGGRRCGGEVGKWMESHRTECTLCLDFKTDHPSVYITIEVQLTAEN